MLAEALARSGLCLHADGPEDEVELQPAGTSEDAAHSDRDTRGTRDNRWTVDDHPQDRRITLKRPPVESHETNVLSDRAISEQIADGSS